MRRILGELLTYGLAIAAVLFVVYVAFLYGFLLRHDFPVPSEPPVVRTQPVDPSAFISSGKPSGESAP